MIGGGLLKALLSLPRRVARRVRNVARPAKAEPEPESLVGRKHAPPVEETPGEKVRRHRRKAKWGLLAWLRDSPKPISLDVMRSRASSLYYLDGEAWDSLWAEMSGEHLVHEEGGVLAITDAGRAVAESDR
jgi:hypothetical protein